ncbi:16S rRNA (cytidine(1402)-2'-O)-methyltransferase [Idiomarina xiamenensis]|uniref:Ribosomal RNA small subunit methyltransferase I n=1 Tax=Idiomarina xiamenensis 10-D-4 TaxID=740709 RepID=K2KSH1_9GAMM|nr:16S rRNA (cytidine(1402)-2'-O)-methyltransferase [Idiomarina xiamenensis]EKE85349.1 tetrapyrrole methylase [Idiomarina xiamenensis 10-D-4]
MSDAGTLYLVPTPIGNLADISERALATLQSVAAIAAEDTRHTRQLLNHYGIQAQVFALHDHNERQQAQGLIARLQQGDNLALVSDAGTPLISDPGYFIVSQCRAMGVKVVPLPGPCAVTTALSGAGLATDRFCFEGFVAAKPQQRRKQLNALVDEPRTLVFYESPHRILASLTDFIECFGGDRQCVLARELTKQFETFLSGSLSSVAEQVQADSNQQRGEMVLMLAGATPAKAHDSLPPEAQQLLQRLLAELPLKRAAAVVADIHGVRKNDVYQFGLTIND